MNLNDLAQDSTEFSDTMVAYDGAEDVSSIETDAAQATAIWETIQKSEVTVAEMTADVAREEAFISAGSAISTQTTAAAVATYNAQLSRLGMSATTLSVEDYESDPAIGLKLAVEDKRSMLKKVGDMMRKAYIKFVTFVRKTFLKILTYFDKIEDKGQALTKTMKGGKLDPTKNLTEDKAKKIISRHIASIIGYESVNLKKVKISDILEAEVENMKSISDLDLGKLSKDGVKVAKKLNTSLPDGFASGKCEVIGIYNSVAYYIAGYTPANEATKYKIFSGSIDAEQSMKDIALTTVSGGDAGAISAIVTEATRAAKTFKKGTESAFKKMDSAQKGFEKASKAYAGNDNLKAEYETAKAEYAIKPALIFRSLHSKFKMVINIMATLEDYSQAAKKK